MADAVARGKGVWKDWFEMMTPVSVRKQEGVVAVPPSSLGCNS